MAKSLNLNENGVLPDNLISRVRLTRHEPHNPPVRLRNGAYTSSMALINSQNTVLLQESTVKFTGYDCSVLTFEEENPHFYGKHLFVLRLLLIQLLFLRKPHLRQLLLHVVIQWCNSASGDEIPLRTVFLSECELRKCSAVQRLALVGIRQRQTVECARRPFDRSLSVRRTRRFDRC